MIVVDLSPRFNRRGPFSYNGAENETRYSIFPLGRTDGLYSSLPSSGWIADNASGLPDGVQPMKNNVIMIQFIVPSSVSIACRTAMGLESHPCLSVFFDRDTKEITVTEVMH